MYLKPAGGHCASGADVWGKAGLALRLLFRTFSDIAQERQHHFLNHVSVQWTKYLIAKIDMYSLMCMYTCGFFNIELQVVSCSVVVLRGLELISRGH